MAKQTVSRTALGAATCRLIEQYQPEKYRLFIDPVVKELVGAPIQFLMRFSAMRNFTLKQTDSVAEGIYGAQICRTRYIDDAVQAAQSQGIGQLVILGAGLDTRPYRLPGMERLKVYEIDLPGVQEDKKKKIQQYLGRLPEHVAYLPIDFNTQTLEEAFTDTTFDPYQPTLFVWEGVTQYITEDAVSRTLAFVGKSGHGSEIVLTYVLKSIIEGHSDIPDTKKMMATVAKQSPWIFGVEPSEIQEYLRPFHLALIADVGNAEYQEKYLKPVGRDLAVFAGERIAYATVDERLSP